MGENLSHPPESFPDLASCKNKWCWNSGSVSGSRLGIAAERSPAAGDHERAQGHRHMYQNQEWRQRVCVCQLWRRLYHLGHGVSDSSECLNIVCTSNSWIAIVFLFDHCSARSTNLALLLISLWHFCISLHRRFVSLKMVITTRLFRAVCYHPDIYQIVTSGTDRKVCFFSIFSHDAMYSHCLHYLSWCATKMSDSG